jgi:hypothetical protein
MLKIRRYWVLDRDAYNERRFIMEVEGVDGLTASREASAVGYATRFGRAATWAANDRWRLARKWCEKIATRFGPETAAAVMRDIEDTIEQELKWRRR